METSSHIIMVDFIVCRCTGTSSHIITVDFIVCQGHSGSGHYWVHCWGLVLVYISLISWDGGLLVWVKWWGKVGAVPVSFGVPNCAWWGMYIACVFCSMWGTVGVGVVAAGWGVAGATCGAGCIVWAAGRCVDVVGATSAVACLSSLTVSGWHSQMWLQAHQYCPWLMTWTMYDPLSAAWMMVPGSHRHLASVRMDMVCPVNSRAFCRQPWWLWFAVLREACWSRWSWLAGACGSVWQICCGTIVHRACW